MAVCYELMHQGIRSATFSYAQLFNTPDEQQLHLQILFATLSVLVYSRETKLNCLLLNGFNVEPRGGAVVRGRWVVFGLWWSTSNYNAGCIAFEQLVVCHRHAIDCSRSARSNFLPHLAPIASQHLENNNIKRNMA